MCNMNWCRYHGICMLVTLFRPCTFDIKQSCVRPAVLCILLLCYAIPSASYYCIMCMVIIYALLIYILFLIVIALDAKPACKDKVCCERTISSKTLTCGSDGHWYPNKCFLYKANCTRSISDPMITRIKTNTTGVCGSPPTAGMYDNA